MTTIDNYRFSADRPIKNLEDDLLSRADFSKNLLSGNQIYSQDFEMTSVQDRLDAIIVLIAEFFADYDANRQMVMDTGALVGEIRSEMDKQLGNDYRLRGRGR